jgi:hypothetical protein
MRVERNDISQLATARRQCAFPLRLVRGLAAYFTIIAPVLMLLLGPLIDDWISGPRLLAFLRPLPYVLAVLIAVGIPLLLYRVSRGGPVAGILLSGLLLVGVLSLLAGLAADALSGFPSFDFSTLRPLWPGSIRISTTICCATRGSCHSGSIRC